MPRDPARKGEPVSQEDLLDIVIRPWMAGWGITRLTDVTGPDYLCSTAEHAIRA
jgi:hypothetical protein